MVIFYGWTFTGKVFTNICSLSTECLSEAMKKENDREMIIQIECCFGKNA